MLSQNVAKTTVPSYYMIRTNLPLRKPQNQWEGVYYYSGITKRQQHVLLLQRKREREAAARTFAQSRAAVLAAYDAEQQHASQSTKAALVTAAATPVQFHGRYRVAVQLAQHGMPFEASQLVDALHQQRQLRSGHYVQLIRALAADTLSTCVLYRDAACDPALTFKLVGDVAGEERAGEAYRWYDMGMTALREECHANSVGGVSGVEGTAAATALTNALMRALLTCGYEHVKAIPTAVYDRMGVRGISPTITTYELVMTSLALQGQLKEAEEVLCFLRHRHSEHVTINAFNALFLGHREAKAYDRCDALWQELVDRRWPRANALSAELYLRSIVDHSYTPTSEPLQRFGNVNVVAKKKVPMVLTQMDELGIPRSHLSRPLMDEVEDALRKFSIYKNRFYEWGRAVKQFDFIEFRRRHGWMYDLHLMKDTTRMTPIPRDYNDPDATLAPIATAELPAFFSERPSWESTPLEDVLYVSRDRERTDDVRAGDIYYDDSVSVHNRSTTWMSEVPETRYDQLYGVNHPDVAKIGVRRYLDVEYVNRQEVLARDAAVMRKSLSHGRRVRQRMENTRTHRNEAQLNASGGKRKK